MKKLNVIKVLCLSGAMALGLASCSKDADEQEIAEDAKVTEAELQAVFETEQWTGAADNALTELFQGANGASNKTASNECYQAEYTDTGFIAVFGNCVLNGTENVNGTLVVTYGADPENATFTATYDGFYVGNIEVNGTRTFSLGVGTGENSIAFQITSDMTVTMEDGSVISENGTKTLELSFGENLEDVSISLSGSWTLSMDGNTYGVSIESPLTGGFACEYLVSGIMELSKNGLAVSVDLGDGTCDNLAILTYPNGAQEELEF